MKNLERYLKMIAVEHQNLFKLSVADELTYLQKIYYAHLLRFPYHNFELRAMSQQHPVRRNSLNLFSHLSLLSTQNGGYCYQSAQLLFHMLRELGFNVHRCSGRVINGLAVNSKEVFAIPANHVLLVVKIAENQYLLDPGLGGRAPRFPILITGDDRVIKQNHDQFKFYPYDNVYVLERMVNNAWVRVMQTDLQCIDDKKLAFTLLQLERFPHTIEIRDQKTAATAITETGNKSLLWMSSTNKFVMTREVNGVFIKEEFSGVKQAYIALLTEFDITHVSMQDFAKFCQPNTLPLPQRRWSFDLSASENALEGEARQEYAEEERDLVIDNPEREHSVK